MILTDKCKEQFELWLMNGNDGVSNFGRTIKLTRIYFLSLKESCQHALIIEFFDSVGIYINTSHIPFSKEFRVEVREYDNTFLSSCDYIPFNTRTEATQSAITKANEIFNNLNK